MKHYSIRTEQSYVDWIKCCILFHNKRHPADMGEDEVRSFISELASKKSVAASTQTVALGERRAKSKEQRAKGKGQRAKGKELLPSLLALGPLPLGVMVRIAVPVAA